MTTGSVSVVLMILALAVQLASVRDTGVKELTGYMLRFALKGEEAKHKL